jgi:hypothetical protein
VGRRRFRKIRRWYGELESIGPENVQALLAQTDAGSAGATLLIGTEMMTIGFAQHWLAWHDWQRAERETSLRQRQILWMALVATAIALVGATGWLLTAWAKW